MKVKCLLISLSLGVGMGLTLLWLVGVGAVVQAAPGAELHVCPSGCPYSSIQTAVDAAQDSDVIKVAQGSYTDVHHIAGLTTANFTATQVVAITKSITIRGGYTTTDWNVPDPEANPTILDAGGQGRVIVISGTITTTIDGLHITDGDASGLGGHYSGARDAGGGVYVYAATVEIRNCNVYNNSAHTGEWANGYGGGIYLGSSSQSTLERNIVSGNIGSTKGHGYGGGLHLYDSHYASLKGNYIDGNIGANANGEGGGMYLYYSNFATLDDNTIIDNVGSQGANYYGGGLLLKSSDHATLTGNIIKGNTAGAAWSWGGGLYLDRSDDATLIGNTIEGNTASTYDGWGGGLYVRRSMDLTMIGNVVSSNAGTSNLSGSSWGGGIYIERGGPFTLTNNVLVGNEVTTAGSGMYIEEASPRLLHTTIASNTGGDGSGVYITGTLSTVAMTNTIIFSHTVGITVSSGSTVALNSNLWYENEMDWGGAGTINHVNDNTGDPAFAPDGYHLTSASAAIDQGVDANVTMDIDGDTRPQRWGYDIGADEFLSRIYMPLVMRRDQP